MLTRRRPGVYARGTCDWLYDRALPPSVLTTDSFSTRLLLQLVEHLRKRALHLESLLDLVGAEIRVLPILQEARALVVPHEPDERLRVGLPVLRETFQVLEDGVHAEAREERHGVLRVLVEVRVENALIHEVGHAVDGEEKPPQIVQL